MSKSNNPKKVLAVAAAATIAAGSVPAFHAENLLAGMSMNGAPNQAQAPQGPQVVSNNKAPSVSKPVQVPEVSPSSVGNLAPTVNKPTQKTDVPKSDIQLKTEDQIDTQPKPGIPDENGNSGI